MKALMKRSHSFLPVLTEQTLSAQCVSSRVLGTGGPTVNTSDEILVPMEMCEPAVFLREACYQVRRTKHRLINNCSIECYQQYGCVNWEENMLIGSSSY